ncbi:MAG TPA: hypothetical protein VKR30_10460 [Candidatus Limnocylindrales bacterium]|nr:hypothetical protein [Candidatus Limnocylindrales bacterium]
MQQHGRLSALQESAHASLVGKGKDDVVCRLDRRLILAPPAPGCHRAGTQDLRGTQGLVRGRRDRETGVGGAE